MKLRHPEVADRDCAVCQIWLFNEDTGAMTKGRDGKPEKREIYGPLTCPPICRTEKGCPKGTPENQKSLSPENDRCYEHYRECRAVGAFPDDAIVKRNAAVIREIEDLSEKMERKDFEHKMIMANMRTT